LFFNGLSINLRENLFNQLFKKAVMKKVLFIATVLCLLSVISCSPDTIEDIQQEEQLQKDLELIDIHAKVDTGKDDSVNSGDDGGTDDGDNGEG